MKKLPRYIKKLSGEKKKFSLPKLNIFDKLGPIVILVILFSITIIIMLSAISFQKQDIIITDKNVFIIVRDWAELNDNIAILTICLMYTYFWDNILRMHKKKPQGKVRGVKI